MNSRNLAILAVGLAAATFACGGGTTVHEDDKAKAVVDGNTTTVTDKTTGAQVTVNQSAGVPEGFPAEFVYPNVATHDDAGSMVSKSPEGTYAALVSFTSDDAAKVAAHYHGIFKSGGFTEEQEITTAESRIISASKGATSVVIGIAAGKKDPVDPKESMTSVTVTVNIAAAASN